MFLVINLGLKSIRGIVYDSLGEILYSKAFPVHTILFREKVEQDAAEWLNLLDLILKDLNNNTNLSKQILFITTTTSSSCILGLDHKKNPCTKVLMVSDKRSLEQVAYIKQDEEYKSEYGVGLASLLPKVLWFRDNDIEVFKQVKYWVNAGEVLSYFFTGDIFIDELNAGKACYSKGEYPEKLFKNISFDKDTLSNVLPLGTKIPVLKKIINRYNFNSNCDYILSTYDALCAVIGSNIGELDNACDVSGTVTSVRALHSNLLITNNPTLIAQKIDFLGTNVVGASNNLGGGIIEWLKQSYFSENGDDPYYRMEKLAYESSIGAEGLILLPYMLGERAPFNEPDATGCYFGISRSTTLKDFTRAAFEATAFVTNDLLSLIVSNDKQINSLSVSGGLARFDLINQIKADVCGVPVHVISNFESTSTGAFIIAALAVGKFNTLEEALKKTVKIRKTIYPSEKNIDLYREYFGLYKKINEALSPIYREHVRVKSLRKIYENEIVSNL